MEKYIEIRKLWDNVFKTNFGSNLVKIIGVVSIIVSTYAVLQIAPFRAGVPEQIIIVIPFMLGALYFFSAAGATALFAMILIGCLTGTMPLLALLAGLVLLFCSGAPRIMQIVFILTPLFLMNIPDSVNSLLSVNLPFLALVLGVYFACRIGENAYLFGYPMYYTLLAFCFDFYVKLTDKLVIFEKEKLMVPVDDETGVTAVERYFQLINLENSTNIVIAISASIIIVLFINVLLSYLVNGCFSIKNIKIIKYPVDIREAVIILIMACLIIVSLVGISMIEGLTPYDQLPIIQVLLQSMIAYIVTRPFASNDAMRVLAATMTKTKEDQIKAALSAAEYAKTPTEEINAILRTYLDEKTFNYIIDGDKTPINAVLMVGDSELDKRLVLQNVLSGSSFKSEIHDGKELLELFEIDGKIDAFENIIKHSVPTVFIIDKVEGLAGKTVESNLKKDCIEYMCQQIMEHKQNRNILFVLTTSNTDELEDDLFEKGVVEKTIHVTLRESLLLSNTYQILSPIGKGGAGLVYKAYHMRLKSYVVVKRIIANFKDKSLYRAEAEALKRIKHSYLPRVYDIFEENGDYYTVMDFIPGNTLQQEIVKTGQFDEKDVVKWANQLGDVVGYLHSQNPPMIHSDIKPDNVMLTPTGDICLIDFNISFALDQNKTNAVGYTPRYSPIEQYGTYSNYEGILRKYNEILEKAVEPEVDSEAETMIMEMPLPDMGCSDEEIEKYIEKGFGEKSDIYALGATLYCLLAGEPPHINVNKIKPIKYYRNDISDALAYLVDKALKIDPDERFVNMAEFKKAVVKATANIESD